MAFIAQKITEAKINNLIKKREIALQKKKYEKVWELNMQIDNHMNRLVTLSY